MSVKPSYLQEQFDSSFYKYKLIFAEQKAYVSAVFSLLVEDTRLPKDFFDLEKNIRKHARRHSLGLTAAKNQILSDPQILFELYDVPYKKKPANPKQKNILQQIRPTSAPGMKAFPVKKSMHPTEADQLRAAWHVVYTQNIIPSEKDLLLFKQDLQHQSLSLRPPRRRPNQFMSKSRIAAQNNDESLGFRYRLWDVFCSLCDTFEETGKYPRKNDGLIEHGPMADGTTTWWMTDYALSKQSPSLVVHRFATESKNKATRSLYSFMVSFGFTRAKEIVATPAKDAPTTGSQSFIITLEDVYKTVLQTYLADGKRPTITRKMIEHGPLKGKMTVGALDEAIKYEYHGLVNTGYKNLVHFMDEKHIPAYDGKKPKYSKKNKLDIDELNASIYATIEATGTRPTKNMGIIEHGPLAGKEYWNRIDKAFRRGDRGLDKTSSKSLSAHMDSLGIPKNPGHAKSFAGTTVKPLLFLTDIKDTVLSVFEATGRILTATSKEIEHGALRGQTTGNAINSAMAGGTRGLKDCGFKSLSEFTASLGLKTNNQPNPVAVAHIFQECAKYAKGQPYQYVPEIGPINPVLAKVDTELRKGNVHGLETISQGRPPTNAIDFMLATGLLQRHGDRVFTVSPRMVDQLEKNFA